MSKQNIYVAMGSLAYAVAKADGQIQPEEKVQIKRIAQEVLFNEDIDNNYIDKMMQTLESDNISMEDAYQYALDVLEANKHEYDFHESVKNQCIAFLESIAESFQGTTSGELELIERFKKDLEKL